MRTRPTSPHENCGLTRRTSGYYARYYEDGAQRMQSLGTKDIVLARALRDMFYADMPPQEQEHGGSKRGRKRIEPPGMTRSIPPGVAYRKPWCLKIDGIKKGAYHTFDEVMEAYARRSRL